MIIIIINYFLLHCNFGDKHKTIAPADMKNSRKGNVKGSFCTVTRDMKIYNHVQRYIKICLRLCRRERLTVLMNFRRWGSRERSQNLSGLEIAHGWVGKLFAGKLVWSQHIPLLVNNTQSSPLGPIGMFLSQIFELHWTTGTNFASSPSHRLQLACVLRSAFLSIAELDTNMANVWK